MGVERVKQGLLCLLWGALGCSLVHAQAVENTTTATSTQSFFDLLIQKTTLSYYGIYRGAPLADLTNSLQPTPKGILDPGNPQSVESLVTFGYRFSPDLTFNAIAHFYYFPIGNPAGTGHSIQMLDPMLMIQRTNVINRNGFRLSARLYFQLGTSQADLKGSNLLASVTPTVIVNYEVPGTKLTIGAYSYFRAYIPSPDAAPNSPTYKIVIAPNANYPLSSTVAATLWVDFVQATRFGGSGFISGLTNPLMDIEPGISWDISKYFSINPVINIYIYPSNPTLAATSLQAYIIAKAF
jgi:hypothetical protein